MLGYVPYKESVTILKQGEVDAWGIKVRGAEVVLPCYIREASASERVESVGSDTFTVTYTVAFEGRAPVSVGDTLLAYGERFKIRRVMFLKDLDRNIISTKVVI